MENAYKHRTFRNLGLATIGLVYFLILVGGIVRSTGSGMGCPDWPKCFGQWTPPTSADQLPENYQDIYSEKRMAKNQRLAKYLDFFGFGSTANRLLTDDSIKEERPFNLLQTWIEYVNRLIGVFVGFFILLTAFFSFRLRKIDKGVPAWAVASLLLVIFQGWLGSLVVSTNLLPGMVTVHMLLALAVVSMLIYTIARSFRGVCQSNAVAGLSKLNGVLVASMLLFLLQIVLGTQVRENIDVVAASFDHLNREAWIGQLGVSFYIHRSYSLLVLALHIYLWWLLKAAPNVEPLFAKLLLLTIVLEIASGAGMAYFAIPSYLQPFHLLVANLIFGLQFTLFIRLNFDRLFPNRQAQTAQ